MINVGVFWGVFLVWGDDAHGTTYWTGRTNAGLNSASFCGSHLGRQRLPGKLAWQIPAALGAFPLWAPGTEHLERQFLAGHHPQGTAQTAWTPPSLPVKKAYLPWTFGGGASSFVHRPSRAEEVLSGARRRDNTSAFSLVLTAAHPDLPLLKPLDKIIIALIRKSDKDTTQTKMAGQHPSWTWMQKSSLNISKLNSAFKGSHPVIRWDLFQGWRLVHHLWLHQHETPDKESEG